MAKANRNIFGTPLEQRGDDFAIRAINSVKPNGARHNPASCSPITWLLNSPDQRAWPSDEEFQPDYFGALSAAYQAGYRAGRRRHSVGYFRKEAKRG